jgi:folate-dependent phosphoribosylglycinamide formyltransferase PurN
MTTPAGPRGRLLLDRLHRRGIELDAVLVLTGGLGPPAARPHESAVHRLARWPISAVRSARRKVNLYRRHHRWLTARCRRVVTTGELNSRRLQRDLQRLAPDYLVLGGGGILQPHIIATAGSGVLNAHPALLPWVRGCGVVGYSLEQQVALGATVHFVDAGIDTGPVVARRLLPVPAGPAALRDLETAVDVVAAELMTDVVEALVRRGERPTGVPHDERFPLNRLASAAVDRPAHEALAESGRAAALFDRWSPLAVDAAWTLPTRPLTAARHLG